MLISLLVAGTLGIFMYNDFKKEVKVLEKKEKEEKEESSMPKKDVKKKQEIVSENQQPESFIRGLYRDLYFGKGCNFGMENATDTDCIMHVFQEDKTINFLFDIELLDGRGNPTVKDFLNSINSEVEYVTTNLVKYTSKPQKYLVGIIWYTYKTDNDSEVYEARVLKPEIYSDFQGLKDFLDSVKNCGYTPQLKETLREMYQIPTEDFEINSISLSYRVSFPLAGKLGIGMTKETAGNSIISLSKTKVEKNGVKTTYGNILFHESENLSNYLNVDKDNNIFTDSF